MFKWFENWIIKRLLNRVTDGLPMLKERLEEYWEINKDEIVEQVKEKIKDFVESKVGF
jgi:phage host-nuclease inhibitor protein Gam